MVGLQLIWTQAWKRTRLVILERDHYTCQVRGPKCKGYADQVDHVIPRHEGGAMFDPSNLRASCGPCNGGRRVYVEKRHTPRHRQPATSDNAGQRQW